MFLCNVEITSAPTYLNLENAVCLNVNISEKNITAASLQATIFSLMKGENNLISHDLALSSEDEDVPITPPKSFLKSNVKTECASDNSSSFLPNSDDELAKYLDSELIPDTNIKKEKPEDPDYSPAKMIKKEKKGPSSHKRKQDLDEKKNGHKKRKPSDENTRNMEQCLKIMANLEDLEMKESNMALLAEHLDKHACGRMKSTI